jgi:GntR family transcriptional regulator
LDSLGLTTDGVIQGVGVGSLVARAKAAILESVLAGRFEDDRLPAEPALATMLGVSRTTVRAALQRLEQDGLLSRTPGRGTTIRRQGVPMVGLQNLVGFTPLLEEGGHTVTRRLSWRIGTVAEADPLEEAGLPPTNKCFIFEKLLLANGEPAIWLRDMFPVTVFAKLPRKNQKLPESIFEIGDLLFRERIHHARVVLIPSAADAAVAEQLHLELGEPYLLLKEAHYSEQDNLLGVSEVRVRDRFLRFEVLRRR